MVHLQRAQPKLTLQSRPKVPIFFKSFELLGWESSYLLESKQVPLLLRAVWCRYFNFSGFVVSDWGADHSCSASINAGTPRKPVNLRPVGVNSIAPARLHVRPPPWGVRVR